MSEFRQDPVTGRWVIIAPGRASRPRPIPVARARSPVQACPFCAGNEAMTPPEVWAERAPSTAANSPDWRVRVVPNKYPALETSGDWTVKKNGFDHAMNGAGVHEVIIESPGHIVNMAALSQDQFASMLRAYRARLRALKTDRRWRYLLIYKNHGERAGATFEHVHSQLVALPFVPREAQDEINGADKHFEATGSCIFCDVIRSGSEPGERLVLNLEGFVALCPFAPRFGYETWILPRNHAEAFEQSSDDDLGTLAECLRAVIVKLGAVTDNPPFNLVVHTVPNEKSPNRRYHWHMEILPQITRAAGFEWGTGVHMNSVAPEDAALLLRDAPV
jgi:UDPglucose--hexose-1-phosphate uridylyltransferase